MKKIFLAMMLLATFIFTGCNTQAAINKGIPNKDGNLEVSMFNIGTGDAILIRTKEQTVLIDTANVKHRAEFVNELERFSVTKIDKLILTHPHIDHIGNAKILISPTEEDISEYPYLKKISVGEVYDNGVPYPSKAYKNYLKAVKAAGIPRQSLKAGDKLNFGGGVEFKVLFPTAEYLEDKKNRKSDETEEEEGTDAEKTKRDRNFILNNSSIVAKLTYKDFSMMFTGDCERESEAKILKLYDAKDLKCDILKAGHHGHKNSSSKAFVTAINPNYVLASSGGSKDKNDIARGAPHLKMMERCLNAGVNPKNIFSTRWNGSIIVTSDGKSFSVKPEVAMDWVEKWIAKKRETGER